MTTILSGIMNATRRLAYPLSWAVIWLLRPVKLYAYRTRFALVQNLILECTSFIDFCLVFLNIQNETMLLHWKIYRGDFIFGRAIMPTDYQSAAEALPGPLFKNSNFMGVALLSNDSFSTNSPIIHQCPPVRAQTRGYIDQHIFTERVKGLDVNAVREHCAAILDAWEADSKMATAVAIRRTVLQTTFKLLSNTEIPRDEADRMTRSYMRAFAEMSLLSHYLPFLEGFLGTRKRVRQEVYLKLKALGIDNMTIDMTLFAAMFSIGTLVMRCVEDCRRFQIDYKHLEPNQKRNFIIEAIRLYPTVTTVHRVVESEETITLRGKRLHLKPGDEVAYPIICANRDPAHFTNPDQIDLHRDEAVYDKVLSWSKGSHACPAKELSLTLSRVLLDALAQRFNLQELRIFNPIF